MATISLARLMSEAENAAYRMNAEARRLAAVEADVPLLDLKPKPKPVLQNYPTVNQGQQAYDQQQREIEATKEQIEADMKELNVSATGTDSQANNVKIQRGINLVDILEVAQAITGRHIYDMS